MEIELPYTCDIRPFFVNYFSIYPLKWLFTSFSNLFAIKKWFISTFFPIFLFPFFFYKINIFLILVLWVWNYDWTIAIKNIAYGLCTMYQHICCHSHKKKLNTIDAFLLCNFSYFPLSMQFLKMYFQCFFCIFGFMLIYVCKLTFPSNFSHKGYSSHFCFIDEYFTCILTWILFSFSNNCSIFQFSQKNTTWRVEGEKTIWSNKLYQPWKIKVQKFTKQSTHISLIAKNANNVFTIHMKWNLFIYFVEQILQKKIKKLL